MKSFTRLGVRLTDLFFPPQCVGCSKAGLVFCHQCAQSVDPVVEPICAHCGRPHALSAHLCHRCQAGERDALSLVRIATLYRAPLRPAIHALKYGGQPELAVPLARYLVAVAQQPPWPALLADIHGVVPVPLHAQRMAQRGYNQSALLAGELAAQMGLRLAESWLSRARQTQSQVGLSAAERQQNVADAFLADTNLAGKRLLLIDDLFTTGATLSACAQALQQAGAAAVYGLVLSTPAPATGVSLGDE